MTFDASSYGNTTASATLTFSHTCGVLTDGVLLVGASFYDRTKSVNGITYNGVALTRYITYDDGVRAAKQEIWRLINPPSGTYNVVITLSASIGANQLNGISASYSGVDQTTPIIATNAKSVVTGSHSSHSDILTPTVDGCMVVDFLLCGGASAPTATAGQNTRESHAVLGNQAIAAGDIGPVTPAAATTMSWSFASTSTASNHIVIGLNPAAATARQQTLTLLGVGV